MFQFYRGLSERIRLLVKSLMLLIMPSVVLAIPFVYVINEKALEVFERQDPYHQFRIIGPLNQIGVVKFSNQITLRELVYRSGGLQRGYVFIHKQPILLSGNQQGNVIDLSSYFNKITVIKKNRYSKKKSFTSKGRDHDRIIRQYKTKIGDKKNEQKRIRYR